MIARRPLLYLAAPYTRPDPVQNTHAVVKVATWLADNTEWTPLVPHLSLLWHAIAPQPLDWWYALDLQYLLRCDAVVRLPGPSTGADREMTEARLNDVLVLPFDELPATARRIWLHAAPW